MKKITIVALIIASTLLLAGCSKYENTATCVKEHQEVRHHSAWTQYVMSGKIMTPIHHPAYDSEVLICDEWK